MFHKPWFVFFCWLILALILTVIIELSGIDSDVAHWFYDPISKTWLLSQQDRYWRIVLYEGPKILYGIGGVAILLRILWLRWKHKSFDPARSWLVVFLSMIIIPSIVALLKKTTHMYCPIQLKEFGGSYSYHHLFDFKQAIKAPHAQCYPAGHATIGFSLMSLIVVCRQHRAKLHILIVTCLVGWLIGLYQMANGAHFLSHTVATMILAFGLIDFLFRVVLKSKTKDELIR